MAGHVEGLADHLHAICAADACHVRDCSSHASILTKLLSHCLAGGACCLSRRGDWWTRLATNLVHLKRKNEALEQARMKHSPVDCAVQHATIVGSCLPRLWKTYCLSSVLLLFTLLLVLPYQVEAALADEWLSRGDRLGLQRRWLRLGASVLARLGLGWLVSRLGMLLCAPLCIWDQRAARVHAANGGMHPCLLSLPPCLQPRSRPTRAVRRAAGWCRPGPKRPAGSRRKCALWVGRSTTPQARRAQGGEPSLRLSYSPEHVRCVWLAVTSCCLHCRNQGTFDRLGQVHLLTSMQRAFCLSAG